MGYRRRTPGSRRDRRRTSRGAQRRATQGADKSFFLVLGLFLVATILILAALALFVQ